MDLLQLGYFREVARRENISQAARDLNIAQPSLSHAIKQVESHVGVELFDRRGKRIVLNDKGRVYLSYIDRVFVDLESAKREVAEMSGVAQMKVNILFYGGSLLIPGLVAEIERADHDIVPYVFQISAQEAGGPAPDLTVFTSSKESLREGATLLLSEQVGVVMPANHPLAMKEKVRLDDLRSCRFLQLGEHHDFHRQIMGSLREVGFDPLVSTVVNTAHVLGELVRCGLGFAFVPAMSWHDCLEGPLVFRTVIDLPLCRYLYIEWDELSFHSRAVVVARKAIIRYCRRFVREHSLQAMDGNVWGSEEPQTL